MVLAIVGLFPKAGLHPKAGRIPEGVTKSFFQIQKCIFFADKIVQIEDDVIASTLAKVSGVIRTDTKMVTGCLRKTKVAIFVV